MLRFVCVIRFHVSAGRESLLLRFFPFNFPRTSSQDYRVCFSAVQWLSMCSSTNSRAEYLFFTEQLNFSDISLLFRFWVLYLESGPLIRSRWALSFTFRVPSRRLWSEETSLPLSANCNVVSLVGWSTIRKYPCGSTDGFVGWNAATNDWIVEST